MPEGLGQQTFHGQIWRSCCPLSTSRAKGSREEELGGRRERWEGGFLRKDSKFRHWVGAVRYKGAAGGLTDTPLNQVRGDLGCELCGQPWNAPRRDSAFRGKGTQGGGRPRVLLELPFSTPGCSHQQSGGSKGKTRNLFSSPTSISLPASAISHCLHPVWPVSISLSLWMASLSVCFYLTSWSSSILTTLILLSLSPHCPSFSAVHSNLLASLFPTRILHLVHLY